LELFSEIYSYRVRVADKRPPAPKKGFRPRAPTEKREPPKIDRPQKKSTATYQTKQTKTTDRADQKQYKNTSTAKQRLKKRP